MLGCYPVLSLNGLKLCKFVSRSDLILDADHSLDFLSYLVLQACILFCSVSDKSGALLFCLVRIKMPLLTCSPAPQIGTSSGDSVQEG